MKQCPYCDHSFPDDKRVCPECGSSYWGEEDGQNFDALPQEKEEETKGCLSLFLMPITISLLVTALLISAGFIVNLFIYFETSHIKLIWIGFSVLAGLFVYKLFIHYQNNNQSTKKEH